ncbi:hypothetical protein [Pseudanabaena sp. ABRG5-3]|uniref:hypothetical protein n=1 Tax=Pseudanabaena sp. ABRG5-3 TaxID=685565 RepID=UPI0013A64CCA|nr:hypothetical protein [Pseudanabaena sp. ABRG5-3]
MLISNMSVDVVAQLTGLTAKQVQKLQKLSNKNSQITFALLQRNQFFVIVL